MKKEKSSTNVSNHYQSKKILILRIISIIFLFISFFGCTKKNVQKEKVEVQIHKIMNDWHSNAKNANFEAFFNRMSNFSRYIGTDSNENWTKKEFQVFARPYFDKNETWDFKTLKRNLFFSKNSNVIWFDELLDTRMGDCRGSGVLEKEKGIWKIKHYVLSLAISNDKLQKVIAIKKDIIDSKKNDLN